ncbi:hypothetical protein SAMN05216344_102218 [Polaromonas sp. OV174]|uniref:hypothetical protein n=1 Tax=Polaromonas sp. OV174 TaxID=1855300 RepID=UPI0008DF6B65|nr:hypothetical protein [Polaromonas sp. OV174]SFB74732.1 hypothetical protein SAMN05216344_102218 [Polaromonas sp. OV174]
MTRDDVIRIAREAKVLPAVIGSTTGHFAYIERFAALVAATEREACAQACSADTLAYPPHMGSDGVFWEWGVEACAAAIRARGAP